MAWRISGTYIATCNCNSLCPCPVDGPPTSEDGQCRGIGVFHVADGNLDDADLSGVDVALINHFPSNLTSGGWKLLFGEMAELGEDMIPLEVSASGNCRPVELRLPQTGS